MTFNDKIYGGGLQEAFAVYDAGVDEHYKIDEPEVYFDSNGLVWGSSINTYTENMPYGEDRLLIKLVEMNLEGEKE
jgi:hypothetical protein